MQKIIIKTPDNIDIVGLLWDVGADQTALLLHMMPATKESWLPLAEKLFAKGINVLAIDFRGHGESGGGDYKTFKPEQHYGYFEDVRASLEFIQEKYPDEEVVMAGASIGANLVLYEMMGTNDQKSLLPHGATLTLNPSPIGRGRQITRGVSLSAGLDYYGVRAIDYVEQLSREQSVLFVGSRDDGRSSGMDCGAMAEALYDKCTGQKEKIIFETGGHGTDMWQEHSELLDKALEFLAS